MVINKPGDYVLLKNAQLFKSKTLIGADFVVKLGGGGLNYGRTIKKLATHDLNFVIADNQQISDVVK